MEVDDLAALGQADAGAGDLLVGVEAAENLEDALEITRLDADAVIAHGQFVKAGQVAVGNLDAGRTPGVRKLERVGDQVLKQVAQQRGKTEQTGGQAGDNDNFSLFFGDAFGEVVFQAFDQFGQVDGRGVGVLADFGKLEQVLHQQAHPFGGVGDVVHHRLALLVELGRVFLQQYFGERTDGSQRGLEVVGNGVGKLFRLGVAAAQFLIEFLELVAQAARLDEPLDLPAQNFERFALGFGQHAGFEIEDAEGAEGVAVVHAQGVAGVEHHAGVSGDEGIVGKAPVEAKVGHLEDLIVQFDGVIAERVLPVGLADGCAVV